MKEFIYDLSMSVVAGILTIAGLALGVYLVLNQWITATYSQSVAVVVGAYLLSIIWNVRFDAGDDE